jgi:hypothetical protein
MQPPFTTAKVRKAVGFKLSRSGLSPFLLSITAKQALPQAANSQAWMFVDLTPQPELQEHRQPFVENVFWMRVIEYLKHLETGSSRRALGFNANFSEHGQRRSNNICKCGGAL